MFFVRTAALQRSATPRWQSAALRVAETECEPDFATSIRLPSLYVVCFVGFSPARGRVPLRALGHGSDGDGGVLAAAEELGPVRSWAFNLDDDGYRVAGRDTPRDFRSGERPIRNRARQILGDSHGHLSVATGSLGGARGPPYVPPPNSTRS